MTATATPKKNTCSPKAFQSVCMRFGLGFLSSLVHSSSSFSVCGVDLKLGLTSKKSSSVICLVRPSLNISLIHLEGNMVFIIVEKSYASNFN